MAFQAYLCFFPSTNVVRDRHVYQNAKDSGNGASVTTPSVAIGCGRIYHALGLAIAVTDLGHV